MYAVIASGGKQYRVRPGDVIEVERLEAPHDRGQALEFDRVLMVGGDAEVRVGSPLLAGAAVRAVSLGEVRGSKLTVFKKKRRKRYRRLTGHRQDLVRVRIEDISAQPTPGAGVP